MKILFRLCFFVFLPIILIVGLSLIFTGVDERGMVLAIGIPCILVGYFLVWFIAPNKKVSKSTDEQSKQNQTVSDEVKVSDDEKSNSGELLKTKNDQTTLIATDDPKYAARKAMIFVITFFLLMVVDVIAAVVLVINKVFVGGIVCAALFGVLLITIIITTFIHEKISMSKNPKYAKKIISGKVKSCILSNMEKAKSNSTIKVDAVNYSVVVTAEDGCEYTANSYRSYEEEESIFIAVMNKNRAIIVEESQIEEIERIRNNKPKNVMPTAGRTRNHARHHHTHRH